MRGLIPSTILIFGLGSRLFLGEGTAGIRQIVDRVVIVHMARDDADRSCGADGLCIARTVRQELARWQVTQRRTLSLRQHDRLSHRERRVCHGSGKRQTVVFLRQRQPGPQTRGSSILGEEITRAARGLRQR